jgi:3-oxoacyl-[acyl-carrier protein] reductase
VNLRAAVALVTGGSSGIGRATARRLVEVGARVAICGRRRSELEATASEIGALPLVADVSRETDVVGAVEALLREFGDYNVLINNAGAGYFAPLVDIDETRMRTLLETNVVGAMLVARESAARFARRGGGHIVNVGSLAALEGFEGGTAYAATKFALRGMAQCWRRELQPLGIRVMQVHPGKTMTNFARTAGLASRSSEFRLRPEDVAEIIVQMLASDDRVSLDEVEVRQARPD